jgi:hypothetical protein
LYGAYDAAPVDGGGWADDQESELLYDSPSGIVIGPPAASSWLHDVPIGLYDILVWHNNRYTVNNVKPVIIVTENGCDVVNETAMPLKEALNDTYRFQTSLLG